LKRNAARIFALFFVRLCVPNTAPAGVDFNVIAREWRMKWSADNDKQSLALALACPE
jgi:hypothetical protein